jgi:hypothetical protein
MAAVTKAAQAVVKESRGETCRMLAWSLIACKCIRADDYII